MPVDAVVEQVQSHLHSSPDYITLAGAGEPTLYLHIRHLIERIKEISSVPVAVITNGSLLWKPEVRQALMQADLVIPSLDASCARLFKYVNRPHPQITFERMLRGLVAFRREFKGDYWLEVFLLAGVTTTDMEVTSLAECIRKIEPDRIQVNTAVRPPCENYVTAVPENQLEAIARRLYDKVEVIADYVSAQEDQSPSEVRAEEILALLGRRPCSLKDIASGLSLRHHEISKKMAELRHHGLVEVRPQNGTLYYTRARGDAV
jgi:wyosine [tRNA(Phe)-imidazoG37] synthetase (radical SAM superfamily)